MLAEIVYPDAQKPMILLREVSSIFTQIPYVSHIYIFGSLVGVHWDRWSDIDMLVVTQKQKQFYEVWEHLHRAKPVLHHHPLSAGLPSGRHILGNVFIDESVFHCLDLNFLTACEHQQPGVLDRFGSLREIYRTTDSMTVQDEDVLSQLQELTDDERRISIGMHFTKKAAKKILRGEPAYDDLKHNSDDLRMIMRNYPADYQVIGGEIGKVAQTYLTIADYLLEKRI